MPNPQTPSHVILEVRSARPVPLAMHVNPMRMVRNLWSHRELALHLARRDLTARYREARLGLLWAVLTPLLLLAVYTFVFSVVFDLRWGLDEEASRGRFAMAMFCGILLFTLFSDVVNQSPTLVATNPSYVKRVVFPLEVLVVSSILSGLVTMGIGYLVWIAGWLLLVGEGLTWTMLWAPLTVLPVVLTTMGIAWMLASLGVFLRDVRHAVAIGVQVLFFCTPIFYSLEQVPMPFRRVLELNPLTYAVENMRLVLMFDQAPDWIALAGGTILSAIVALFGYAFFMKSRRAFADVM